MQAVLDRVLCSLEIWRAHHRGFTAKRCLEAVRWACGERGLRLPWRPWPWNTALGCLSVLKKNPERYGWTKAERHPDGSLPSPCLIFFDDCGKLKDGRIAGHIAILNHGWHYANDNYELTPYWESRIAGAFVPKE